MAKLRKWCAYRTIERPYTRFSKYRKKAFVKSRPGKKVIKFDMGDVKGGKNQFPVVLKLLSKEVGLARANAIEAARITALRGLERKFGRLGFYFQIKMVPHHAIRENPLAAGAGADRLSTGMKHSFGKIIGTAARIEPKKILMEIYVTTEGEAEGRAALKRASKKLPLRTMITMNTQTVIELTAEQIEAHKIELEKIAKIEAERKAADEAKAEADAAAGAEEKKEE